MWRLKEQENRIHFWSPITFAFQLCFWNLKRWFAWPSIATQMTSFMSQTNSQTCLRLKKNTTYVIMRLDYTFQVTHINHSKFNNEHDLKGLCIHLKRKKNHIHFDLLQLLHFNSNLETWKCLNARSSNPNKTTTSFPEPIQLPKLSPIKTLCVVPRSDCIFVVHQPL
jgi:hypothetical protein